MAHNNLRQLRTRALFIILVVLAAMWVVVAITPAVAKEAMVLVLGALIAVILAWDMRHAI